MKPSIISPHSIHSAVMKETLVQNPHVHTDTSTPHVSTCKFNLLLNYFILTNLSGKEHQRAYDREQEQLANLKMKAGKSFSK